MKIVEDVEITLGDLHPGMVTYGPTGRVVKIIDGTYWTRDPFGVQRISNFWYWKTLDENGVLGPTESGYGWTPRKPTPTNKE